ncbi:hypothetical protein DMUE_1740 [Dictyocoela muelleri]|nr:hypothetical protein DMUE_1740 [Dictyocoela muelleri]
MYCQQDLLFQDFESPIEFIKVYTRVYNLQVKLPQKVFYEDIPYSKKYEIELLNFLFKNAESDENYEKMKEVGKIIYQIKHSKRNKIVESDGKIDNKNFDNFKNDKNNDTNNNDIKIINTNIDIKNDDIKNDGINNTNKIDTNDIYIKNTNNIDIKNNLFCDYSFDNDYSQSVDVHLNPRNLKNIKNLRKNENYIYEKSYFDSEFFDLTLSIYKKALIYFIDITEDQLYKTFDKIKIRIENKKISKNDRVVKFLILKMKTFYEFTDLKLNFENLFFDELIENLEFHFADIPIFVEKIIFYSEILQLLNMEISENYAFYKCDFNREFEFLGDDIVLEYKKDGILNRVGDFLLKNITESDEKYKIIMNFVSELVLRGIGSNEFIQNMKDSAQSILKMNN